MLKEIIIDAADTAVVADDDDDDDDDDDNILFSEARRKHLALLGLNSRFSIYYFCGLGKEL